MWVAGGGGGDVVAASVLASLDSSKSPDAPLASFVWERNVIDPHPGPRGLDTIRGLAPLGPNIQRVTPETSLLGGGWTPLARLAGALDRPIVVLDLTGGVSLVARQLGALADWVTDSGARPCIVDVGGDILAAGGEPHLRSPIADAVVLAAAADAIPAAGVCVAGWGLDGELLASELAAATEQLANAEIDDARVIPAAAAWRAYQELSWYPTEATLLLLLAATGLRGTVDIGSSALVELGERTAEVRTFAVGAVAARSKIASRIRGTAGLASVEQVIESFGYTSEVRRERDLARVAEADPDDVVVARVLAEAERFLDAPHADFVTHRYLARRGGVRTWPQLLWAKEAVASVHPAVYLHPLLAADADWLTPAQAAS